MNDVKQPDGGDDGAFGVVVDPPQDQPVGQDGDTADDGRPDDQGQGEGTEGRVDQGRAPPGDDGAEHEELAVRDIDDPHDAEDQGQAKRRQGEDEPGHRPFEHGEEEMRPKTHSRITMVGGRG